MGYSGASGHRHARRRVLLPVIAVVLAAAAAASAFFLVVEPLMINPESNRAQSAAPRSSRSTSAPSSSGAASSGASSSSSLPASLKPGSYDYFQSAVFIGDSITSGISLYKIAGNAGVFAADGMSTNSVLKTTVTVGGNKLNVPDAVQQAHPAKVYILLGANDIGWMSQNTYITNYGKLLDALKEKVPNATIYVQSIFPVTAAYETKTAVTNEKIGAFNQALSTLSQQEGVRFVDAGQALRGSDGKLDPDDAASGYNIRKSAYTDWFDYLTEHE